jgi:hypothetical protein
VKTGCNLAESSKEGYGSKRAVSPMLIMMMMMFCFILQINSTVGYRDFCNSKKIGVLNSEIYYLCTRILLTFVQ